MHNMRTTEETALKMASRASVLVSQAIGQIKCNTLTIYSQQALKFVAVVYFNLKMRKQ